MKLTDYMDQGLIYADFNAEDKAGLLGALAALVSERFPQVSHDELRQKLSQREAAGSTGIGHGVAIPHATIEGLPGTLCMLICIRKGIRFDAIDQQPVHLIFLLVSPPGEIGLHIKLLARIARLIKNEQFLNAVATSCDAKELHRLIAEEDNRHVE